MTTNVRMAGPLQLGTVATTLYTCPTSTRATVKNIHVFNGSASAATLFISLGVDAAGTQIFASYSIPARKPLDIRISFILTADEIIQAYSGTNNVLTLTINGKITGVALSTWTVSGNSRYLLQNGVPWPMKGRTSWIVISNSLPDYQDFITDTTTKDFNAIEFAVIAHWPNGTRTPFANNSTLLPFNNQLNGSPWNGSLSYGGNQDTLAPDFSTPNGSYWSFALAFVDYCAARGILCLMFPSYVGFGGGTDGWMLEMVSNGVTKMTAYGAYIANLFRDRTNIVWMLGGDYGTGGPSGNFTAPQLAVEQAMIDGMSSVANQRSTFFSAEWSGSSLATDQTTFGHYINLNGAYSWVDVIGQCQAGYSFASPKMPSFLLEGPYDQEGPDGTNVNSNATQPVRRFQWWSVLSCIGGYMTGNGYVWPFNLTGTLPATDNWKSHLNTQGAQDMANLNAFLDSIPWWGMIPSGLDGMRTLIPTGGGSGTQTITAACASNLLIAYVPPDSAGTFTVDMRSMSAVPIRARWFDPTNSTYHTNATAAGTFTLSNSASAQPFSVPVGGNAQGENDWTLVLDT